MTGRLDHSAEAAREARPQTRWASAGSLFIALLALLGFAAVTIAVASRFVFSFDQPWLASARTLDGLPVIWQAISQSANIPLVAIGVGFVLWLVWKKRRREAVVVILILIAVRSWRSLRSAWLRLALVLVVAFEVVLVGISRLALDEHYPSDLLGGVLGAISALGCYAWLTRPGGWADRPAPNRPGGATAP